MIQKTTVYKDRFHKGNWVVTYYFPYSGILSAEHSTWDDAMTEACAIEKQRAWF